MNTLPKKVFTPWEGPFRVWVISRGSVFHTHVTWNPFRAMKIMDESFNDANVIAAYLYMHLRPHAAPQMVKGRDRHHDTELEVGYPKHPWLNALRDNFF